jgi:hypothetical protein
MVTTRGVERDLDRLGVPGDARADAIVLRPCLLFTTGVARDGHSSRPSCADRHLATPQKQPPAITATFKPFANPPVHRAQAEVQVSLLARRRGACTRQRRRDEAEHASP